MQKRNAELKTANDDLIDILTAVDVAFLIVDNRLRVRRISAAAERLLARGRKPFGTAERQIDVLALHEPIRRVLDTLSVEQCELQDEAGHWYSVTIRPCRTAENRIDGVLVVYNDIDLLKRNRGAAETARDYSEGIVETLREPLLTLDEDLRVLRGTSAFYETFRVLPEEIEGRHLWDLGNGQWEHRRLRELLEDALFRDTAFQDFEIDHDFPSIGRRSMRLNGRRIPDSRTVLLAIEDVTRRPADDEARYLRLFETAKDGILIFDAESEILQDVNPFFLEMTGCTREELVGRRYAEIDILQTSYPEVSLVSEARERSISRRSYMPLMTRRFNRIQVEMIASSYVSQGRQMIQVNVRDVTLRNQAVLAMKESEERFRLLVDSVQDYALFQMDPAGRIASWNSGAERLLGYTEREIVGLSSESLFTPEDAALGEALKELQTARIHGRAENERWHLRKDGSRFLASGVLTLVRDETGSIRGFAKVMRDITELKQTEGRLKQQAELLDLAQDVIAVRQLDGTITFWNHAAAQRYGWDKNEAGGQIIHNLLQTEFSEPLEAIMTTLLAVGRWEGELVHTCRDGSRLNVWSRWALQTDRHGQPTAVLEIDNDITRQKRDQEKLLSSLREKDVLLKEIHHRVKNNLQIIASLLSWQSEFLHDRQALATIEEMHNRVRSIAAIHEMLYGSGDLSRIDFGEYLNRIAQDLAAVYSPQPGRIKLEIVSGTTFLEIRQAVPCGLIVNELLTNSFKYAFPNDRTGVIRVSLSVSDDSFILEIADNGVGLPEEVVPQSAASMGLQLLSLLVQQLKGSLEVKRDSGTRYTITFPRKA